MKTILVSVAFFAIPLSAGAEPIKLTYGQLSALYGSLLALDGTERVVKDGEREHIIKEPYRFGVGTTLAIAKDIAKVRDSLVSAQNVARSIILSYGDVKPGSLEEKKKTDEIQKLNDTEEEIDIIKLNTTELALEKNNIQISTLSNLGPILIDR